MMLSKPEVSSSHASGFVHMVVKLAFHQFPTLTQQPLSTLAPDPPPVLVNSRFLSCLPIQPGLRSGSEQ